VVTAANTRARTSAPINTIAPAPTERRFAFRGSYLFIVIPLVLAATLIWQVASSTFHTEAAVRQAVAVGQVTLEPDPAGTRVDFVLVDRVGQETTFTGNVNVTLRDPDGAVWQTTRSLSPGDFQPLPDDSLLAGRTGYTVLVNVRDWARPPRRGGLATISISATPNDDGPAFSTQSQQRFP
jgi:hypothetical protein